MRCGHTRSVPDGERAIEVRTENARARRSHINRRRAELTEDRQIVPRVGGCHRQNAVQVIAGRKEPEIRRVQVGAAAGAAFAVTGSRHEKHTGVSAFGDRRADVGVERLQSPPAVVTDTNIDVVISHKLCREINRCQCRRQGTRQALPRFTCQKTQWQNGTRPVQTGHTRAIVSHRADHPANVRAVSVFVTRIIVVISKIPADQIVDLAVPFFIKSIRPGRVGQKVASIDEPRQVVIRHKR